MIFERAQGKANVASLVERKTRFAVLFRNNDRSTTHLMNRLMAVVEPLPQPARKSITFDRGIEFRHWRKLKPGSGTKAWLGRSLGTLAEGIGRDTEQAGATIFAT